MSAHPIEIAGTARLRLRLVHAGDAAVYLELLNDPTFIQYIGDRGVRTLEAAVKSIEDGPVTMQRERGHSMYLVEERETGRPVGLSGLIKRDYLEHVDIGYAFLPRYRGLGYAFEAAQAVANHARELGLPHLAAIVDPDNQASIGLLLRLGMRFERFAVLVEGQPGLNIYGMALAQN
jgi:RimJ/RimL family protein N-acetyltransferase